MIADRRRALALSLETVTPQQGALPSLCVGWTVHQVAAHLVMPFSVGLPTLMLGLIRNRGNFDKYSNSWAIAMASKTPLTEISARLREHAEHRFTPPGFGPQAPLTDICVHSFDIGIPLGAPPEVPTDQINVVLDLLTTPRAAKSFAKAGLLDGLHVSSTDSSWSHGSGQTVSGPSWALMLALSARSAALDELSGDGVEVLSSRLT